MDVAVEEGGAGGGTKKTLLVVGNLQRTAPLRVEVGPGSATSWGRPAESCYLVRLCRDDQAVVLAVGMAKAAVEHLAGRLCDLLAPGAGSWPPFLGEAAMTTAVSTQSPPAPLSPSAETVPPAQTCQCRQAEPLS